MRICLVGNPNSGKTTLFNLLTGLNQRVGNYSGVTVDKFTGKVNIGNQLSELVDLPGSYSLYPKSLDESILFNTLLDTEDENYPDLVVLVLNATQIRRNLILVTQVLDLNIPCVVAINMIDEAKRNNVQIEKELLEKELGIPVCLISATRNVGINELKETIYEYSTNSHRQAVIVEEFSDTVVACEEITEDTNSYRNFIHLTLAEKSKALSAAQRIRLLKLREEHEFLPKKAMAKDINQRYAIINELVKKMNKNGQSNAVTTLSNTQKIDKILTHKWFGLPIAFLVLFFIFQAIFSFASYPMDWLEGGFAWLGDIVTGILPEGWVRDLLVDGVIAGLSGVLVFIPQIAILFGLLAILEGTGYMARISYMLDRVMKRFGLSGKSVVPMMSGFACAIPAVMATRNVKNRKERLISIMVIPLLSCSARLPVYILLIGMFVPKEPIIGFFNLQGLTMMGFYLLGLVLALLIAGLMHWWMKTDQKQFFVMELPRYRFPQWRNVLLTMYQKAKIFTVEAGKIILIISVVLWVLASYGPSKQLQAVEDKYETIEQQRDLSVEEERSKNQELLVNSYAGHIGKAIEPAIKPLGYDWKIGIALLTSFAAREVFVGTMATIYSVDAEEEDPISLRERMLAETDPDTGEKVYSLATVFSLLVFFAIAMQCMSTLAIVKRETKSWKWPVIQVVYLTVLAYVLSFVTYQLLS